MAEAEPAGRSELAQRVISAVIMASAAILLAWWGGWPFAIVWGLIGGVALWEWSRLIGGMASPGWLAVGAVYAGVIMLGTLAVRGSGALGFIAILFMFAVVWLTDIGAYFAGRTFGGPKFAPRISPKKTWSGVLGGLAAGILGGCAMLAVAGVPLRPAHGLLALGLGMLVVAGDLFESFLKRRFGVKDAGALIPGHGGVLDRLDGYTFAIGAAA
ncbi:MAG TPA: phosphatidate cytidylyltransferase, partial [Beijerinckiaceae bacterium]|nr:phosphatidate cytidylyltransferase [Beijerinckiaceae bacterium]